MHLKSVSKEMFFAYFSYGRCVYDECMICQSRFRCLKDPQGSCRAKALQIFTPKNDWVDAGRSDVVMDQIHTGNAPFFVAIISHSDVAIYTVNRRKQGLSTMFAEMAKWLTAMEEFHKKRQLFHSWSTGLCANLWTRCFQLPLFFKRVRTTMYTLKLQQSTSSQSWF